MVSTFSKSYKNLPANCTEISALKKLLDGDLEHKSFILRRQEEVQAQYTYAKKAAEGFTDCLATTHMVKDAHAASMLSIKALEKAVKNALNLHDNHCDILETISSTKGMLATWAEIVALTEALLTHLDKATPQVQAHLHLAANEHAAHESAHIAASESMLSCTTMLHEVERSIAKKKGALSGVRRVPTEILQQIFTEAVNERQHEITTSLSSYLGLSPSSHDLDALSKTLNLVPFTLSATCKRWQVICKSTPWLWRYARVPMLNCTHTGYETTGKVQFEQCVLLAQKEPLELTVYPCHDVTYYGATYPNLGLPVGSQILRVNLVSRRNYDIPPGIPSPIELCIVASANSHAVYTQVLHTQLLANTKMLLCTGLTPRIDSAVGIRTLRIFHNRPGAWLSSIAFRDLLQNCPEMEELQLGNGVYRPTQSPIVPFTHQRLHSLFLSVDLLPWVIQAFTAGCRFPRLSRLVLTLNKYNEHNSASNLHSISDQLSRLIYIGVHAALHFSDVAFLRPLFEASTGLRYLALVGSAVEPMLRMLMLPAPKRVQGLRLGDSDANGTTLRDYLAAIESEGGGTSGMQVVWSDCPNFSGEYGGAFGVLHL